MALNKETLLTVIVTYLHDNELVLLRKYSHYLLSAQRNFLPILNWDTPRSLKLVFRLRRPFLWESWQGPRHFRAVGLIWAMALHRDHLKKPCITLIRSVERTTNTDFLSAVEPDIFGRTLLPVVLILLFCIYIQFIQYTCSTHFFFFHVFFLAPERPQH